MCEFHESTCNGFGDNWWTDNPIYFSSVDESVNGAGWVWTDFVIKIPRAIGLGMTKNFNFTKPFERNRLVVRKRIRS